MMKFVSDEPVAIVTGAGSGIGFACTERLAQSFKVIAIGRTIAKLDTVAEKVGDNVIAMPMDVSSFDDVSGLRKFLEDNRLTVKILVNNAGIARDGSTSLDLQELKENWDSVIGTNLTGAFMVSMSAVPFLIKPGGRIVNISSIAAYTGGRSGGSSIYAASKSGLHGLSAGLARELAGAGITVNTIAPGFIGNTEFSASWPKSRIDDIISETPAGRAGDPKEIAALIDFLCSDEGGFLTGEIINANGGWRFGA